MLLGVRQKLRTNLEGSEQSISFSFITLTNQEVIPFYLGVLNKPERVLEDYFNRGLFM